MAENVKIRNKAGEPRFIPSLGIEVDKDEIFEVPDDLADALVSQSIWEEVGPKRKKAAAKPDEASDTAADVEVKS